MRKFRRIFVWICRPQAVVGFLALCLCIGALGTLARSAYATAGNGQCRSQPLRPQAVSQVDCTVRPCMALSFDDGPNPDVTPHILDILARQQVKATFFVVGAHIAGHESILKRQYAEGHEIGNHSWSHPDLSKLTPEQAGEQIQATQRAIAGVGVPVPRLLRPPYGAVSDVVVAHNNLSIVRWNIDPEDWLFRDPAKIQEHLLSQARPGAIILLHDIYPSTVAALEPALQVLKQSYQFVTVSQLLNLTPGDQGQYFSRQR